MPPGFAFIFISVRMFESGVEVHDVGYIHVNAHILLGSVVVGFVERRSIEGRLR